MFFSTYHLAEILLQKSLARISLASSYHLLNLSSGGNSEQKSTTRISTLVIRWLVSNFQISEENVTLENLTMMHLPVNWVVMDFPSNSICHCPILCLLCSNKNNVIQYQSIRFLWIELKGNAQITFGTIRHGFSRTYLVIVSLLRPNNQNVIQYQSFE